MSIVYAAVSRNSTILCERSQNASGNFVNISRSLLNKLPAFTSTSTRSTFQHDEYEFHVLHANNVTYLCLADSGSRMRGFGFLEDVRKEFEEAFTLEEINNAMAYSLNERFSYKLAHAIDRAEDDSLNRVKAQIGELRDVMVENINKVLDRGERVELLVDRTSELEARAFTFDRTANEVRSVHWWRRTKRIMALCVISMFVLLFLVSTACGGPTFKKCK